DPNEEPRNAHYISWYTDGPTKIAVAYCTIDFQSDKSNQSKNSYIWDVENPSKPEMSLKPNSSLICLDYNPKDSHILVGGQMNGQISYWDTRKGSRPVESTPIAVSHHDPVYSTLWLQSKSGSEFFSTSTDGCVLWWDIRKLNEPIEKTILDPTKKNDPTKAHGAYCLEYESTIPTKFMAATEFGTIFSCNRKAKTPQEKIVAVYSGHHGAIYSLQRNPYFIKNFLTVGDWTARIWSEDHRDHAIWWTDFDSTQIMSGGWSPTRPGVFYTAKENGYVDIWDLIFKQKAPTLSIQVTDSPLYCAKISENGALIATGARNGTTTLLRLSDGLVNMQRNEKALVSSIFERETRREKIIETRHREMKLKERVKSATLDEEENDNYKQMVNDIDAEFEIIIEEKGERDGKIKKMFEEIENWGNTKSVEEELPSNE
ncbi:Axonemal dynein intermediate chain 2, partial [Intoshia linei]